MYFFCFAYAENKGYAIDKRHCFNTQKVLSIGKVYFDPCLFHKGPVVTLMTTEILNSSVIHVHAQTIDLAFHKNQIFLHITLAITQKWVNNYTVVLPLVLDIFPHILVCRFCSSILG